LSFHRRINDLDPAVSPLAPVQARDNKLLEQACCTRKDTCRLLTSAWAYYYCVINDGRNKMDSKEAV